MKTNHSFTRALVFAPLFIVTGCALGPDYSRPAVGTATAWKETEPAATPMQAVPLPAAWWQIFDDSDLNIIEAQVIAANQDLQRAAARVTEARALARLTEADLYPNLSFETASTRFRTSPNRAGTVPAVQANDYSAKFDLSYELDFWGRVRRANESARARAAAIGADFHVAQLTLTADAARDYYQLRSLDAERAVVEATLALRRDAVRLQETRNQAGLINEAEVSRARTEAANVEAELHALTRGRARTEHALAVLCGKSPAEFSLAARTSASFALPTIPAGLPATLLQRRPDLAEAEHQLHAACADIGVAKADFFPRLSLTGSAGFASAELNSLTASDSRTWSIGPAVDLPIFDGGRNRANLAATEARYEESLASYRGAMLNAFREVEDALSDLGALSRQHDAVTRALAAARDTALLANERYEKGLSGYLDVVDAQRAALEAERLDTRLRAERTLSTILLAKSLGGGWNDPEMVAAVNDSFAGSVHSGGDRRGSRDL